LITDAKDGAAVVKIAREKTGSIQLNEKVWTH
jgi:cell division protein FtsB